MNFRHILKKNKILALSLFYFLFCLLVVLYLLNIKLVVFRMNTISIYAILILAVISFNFFSFIKRKIKLESTTKTKKVLRYVASALATIIVIAAIFFSPVLLFTSLFERAFPVYVEAKEPVSGRIFVAECSFTFINKGSAELYERRGPFIVHCGQKSYGVEDFGRSGRREMLKATISEDKEKIEISIGSNVVELAG